MLKAIRRFWHKNVLGHWWVPMKCGWPYPEGYCAYNKWTRTLLESGLTREQAEGVCDIMNAYL